MLAIELFILISHFAHVQSFNSGIRVNRLFVLLIELLKLLIALLVRVPQSFRHRSIRAVDKELAAVGVGSGVGHGEGSVDIHQISGELVLKVLLPHADSVRASAVWAAALDHEVLYHPVEGEAVIVAPQGVEFEIVHCLGSFVGEKADFDHLAGFHGDYGDLLPGLGLLQLVAQLLGILLRLQLVHSRHGIHSTDHFTGRRALFPATGGQRKGEEQTKNHANLSFQR